LRRSRGFDRSIRAEVVRLLLDRDGLLCGVCEMPLDPDLAMNDPTATTIDHIVPLREGGEYGHERSIGNLRLTHSRCNGLRVKFDRLPPRWFARELRLAAERAATARASASEASS
jgi:5-methylcytosine-specific restriction endonuclease McrA